MKKVVKSSSAVLIFKVIYVFNAKISGNCLSRINFLYFVSFTYLVIMIFIVVFKMKCQKAATEGVLLKKVFLEISQNSHENTCARDSFLIKLQALSNFIKKEPLAQVFSCKFCEISKNTFFIEHLLTTASEFIYSYLDILLSFCIRHQYTQTGKSTNKMVSNLCR